MCAYLKSIDSKIWKAVLRGWEHPVVLDKDGNKTTVLKPEEEWTAPEDELSLANSKALNAIFNGVDQNVFRMIKQCNVAKKAWEILEITYEGTSGVKISRLQLLTTQFEKLTMKEDENIQEFYMNILDMSNNFDTLGEKMSEEKLVRKILRSLPKRFDMKVIAIEEAQNISEIKIEELIGSLQNFEIIINDRVEKEDHSTGIRKAQGNLGNNENLTESVVLLGKLFNKIVSLATNGQNIKSNIREKQKDKEDQCSECGGFGHLTTECTNFHKKSLNSAWSEKNVSERLNEGMFSRQVTALTGKIYSDDESCDDELEYDDLVTAYKDLHARSTEICKMLGEQKKINNQLLEDKKALLTKVSVGTKCV
jgi:hypothetical protein